MEIINYLEFKKRDLSLDQAIDIFFETSSKKTFKDQNEKNQFEFKYFRYYLQFENLCFFAVSETNKIIGYLVGSTLTPGELYSLHPHLKLFNSEIKHHPAHLHLNLHEKSRGLGVGSKLIRCFEHELKSLQVKSYHIITTSDSRNVAFYLKNRFEKHTMRSDLGPSLLFMVKNLS